MVTPTFKAGLPCLVIPRNSLTHILRRALFILYVLLNPILLTSKFSFQRSEGAAESRRCPRSWLECHFLKLGKEQLRDDFVHVEFEMFMRHADIEIRLRRETRGPFPSIISQTYLRNHIE